MAHCHQSEVLPGVSPKRESKFQLRDVIQRSLGHSNQKLWPKVDFGEFHHVYPLEHFRWVALRYLWVYKGAGSFHDVRKTMKKLSANDTSRYPKVVKFGPNHGWQ